MYVLYVVILEESELLILVCRTSKGSLSSFVKSAVRFLIVRLVCVADLAINFKAWFNGSSTMLDLSFRIRFKYFRCLAITIDFNGINPPSI